MNVVQASARMVGLARRMVGANSWTCKCQSNWTGKDCSQSLYINNGVMSSCQMKIAKAKFVILQFSVLDALQRWCAANGFRWTGSTCMTRISQNGRNWFSSFDWCNRLYSVSYPIPGGSTQFKSRLAQPRNSAIWSVVNGLGGGGWLGLKGSGSWSDMNWYNTQYATDGGACCYPFTTKTVTGPTKGKCAWYDNSAGKVKNWKCTDSRFGMFCEIYVS